MTSIINKEDEKKNLPHRYKPQKESWIEFSIAILYLIGMTSFGSHVVAVVQKVTVFAENCNTSATSIGTVFLANGFGAIVGSLSASPLFKYLNGDVVMGSFLLLLTGVSFGLPNVTSVIVLHILYFLSGVGTGLMDAGPNILLERLLGSRVAPWLIALQLGFNSGGFLGILIQLVFSLSVQALMYGIGVILCFLGVLCILLPVFRTFIPPNDQLVLTMSGKSSVKMSNKILLNPDGDEEGLQLADYRKIDETLGNDDEDDNLKKNNHVITTFESQNENLENMNVVDNRQPESYIMENDEEVEMTNDNDDNGELITNTEEVKKDESNPSSNNYYSDLCLGFVILLIIGSTVSLTAYLPSYVSETKIQSVLAANWQICISWLFQTLGLGFSLIIRKFYFTSDHHVPYLFIAFTSLAALASLIMFIIPKNLRTRSVLWATIVIYSFFAGPCAGLAFQYYSVVTYATETSFAIASLGLNIGAGFLPYFVTVLWDNVNGPDSLFVVVFVAVLLSIPLFLLSAYVSCKRTAISL